jgi:hypothetical protein
VTKRIRFDALTGDPLDLFVSVVVQAYRDAHRLDTDSLEARRLIMDNEWVRLLNVSEETTRRIRDSLPPLRFEQLEFPAES